MCNGWNHSDGCECGFGPPYDRDVADYFDQRIGSEGGRDLSSAGPYSRSLNAVVKNDVLTTQLASTFLWQSYTGLRSRRTRRAARPKPTTVATIYIVRHGKGYPRHDLLIFDQSIEPGKVESGIVEVGTNDLRLGWRTFRASYSIRQNATPKWLSGLSLADVPNIASEAMKAQEHFFIAMHPPRVVWTSGSVAMPSIAAVALPISGSAQGSGFATAGVISADKKGRVGVTTALHAVEKNGKSLFVTGLPCSLRSSDPITDSCFIEIASAQIRVCSPCPGPLTGVTPGQGEAVVFEGATSGHVSTVVIGWTPELPWSIRGVQSRILTPAVTNGGDSGAALVNNNGLIVGFAQYRTAFNAAVAHSAWIWAESVFTALGIQ